MYRVDTSGCACRSGRRFSARVWRALPCIGDARITPRSGALGEQYVAGRWPADDARDSGAEATQEAARSGVQGVLAHPGRVGLAGVAGHHRAGRGLPAHADPAAAGERRQAGLGRLLQRRQERAGALQHGQPGGREAVPGAQDRPVRVPVRRGPQLLQELRRLDQRYRPGRVGHADRWGRAGWIDDHSAVRQELLPDPGPLGQAQDQRDHDRAEDRPEVLQGPDPGGLPQHHLLRPRCVRHPGRLAGVLRGRCVQAERQPGCLPRLGHQRALAVRPLLRQRGESACQRADGLRAGRHGEGRLDDAGAARPAEVPAVQEVQPAGVAGVRAERVHRRRGPQRTAEQAQAVGRGHRSGRSADHQPRSARRHRLRRCRRSTATSRRRR